MSGSREWEFSPIDTTRQGRVSYDIATWLLKALWFPGRMKVSGIENIPKEGAFIIAPNHTSYADPPIAGTAFFPRRRVNFMGKAELFRVPGLGRLVRNWCFPVSRGSADKKAIRTAMRVLASGGGLCVFPEGGRGPGEHTILPGEVGVAMLAARSGAPVIPMGLIGASRCLPKGRPLFLPRACEVRIGKALALETLRGERVRRAEMEAATYEIMGAIAELLGKPHPGVAGTDSAVWPEGYGPQQALGGD